MIPRDPETLWSRVRERASADGKSWLEDKTEAVAQNPGAIAATFPAVGREVGRANLDPSSDPDDPHAWKLDDAGRALLLVAIGDAVGDEIGELYRHGDSAERRGVLRALPLLPVGDSAMPLVQDAIRTNDTNLIAAALGPYAIERLDDAALAQAILKCVFVGVTISPLEGLENRTTPEMSRMLADYVHERIAAGRDVPAEVWPVIERHPPEKEIGEILMELDHPVEERRHAAERALGDSNLPRSRDANL